MRDILVTVAVVILLPIILSKTYVGVLAWSWMSYMNPHRLGWGFAATLPFAAAIAAATIISLFISKEEKNFKFTPITIILIIFVFWMSLTTVFALSPDDAYIQWKKVMKIQFMTFVSLMVINKKEHLNYLVAVIALSIGYFGIKGGIFTILTGGNFRIWGPPGTFIGGNNEIALALIIILPMLRYIQLQVTKKWMSYALLVAMLLIAFAILGSYSRGALLAGICMSATLWLKGKNKFGMTIAFVILLPIFAFFLPQQWFDRMDTIETYEEDASALGRINAWYFAFNLANDRPIIGGGFEAFDRELFLIYAPDPLDFHDAHSIYFEVLAEQGYIGLLLFLSLGILGYLTAGGVIRKAKRHKKLAWAKDLASMMQVSLVGYATGGAFLGLAYFDLFYHILVIIVVTNYLVDKKLSEPEEEIDTIMDSETIVSEKNKDQPSSRY